MQPHEVIQESQFCNTYGHLVLVRVKGKNYLLMEECVGGNYFGPLTDKQVEAFKILCDVPEETYENIHRVGR